MATIRPNDNAPAEEVHYTLPTVEFDLDTGGTYESDDRTVLEAATVHPWLEVEYPEVASEVYTRPSKSVPYKEDPLSEYNDFSNDPVKVEETERAKYSPAETASSGEAEVPAEEPQPPTIATAAPDNYEVEE